MFLAQKLGMTVGRLRAETSNAEFVRWAAYYGIQARRQELERLRAEGGGGG